MKLPEGVALIGFADNVTRVAETEVTNGKCKIGTCQCGKFDGEQTFEAGTAKIGSSDSRKSKMSPIQFEINATIIKAGAIRYFTSRSTK